MFRPRSHKVWPFLFSTLCTELLCLRQNQLPGIPFFICKPLSNLSSSESFLNSSEMFFSLAVRLPFASCRHFDSKHMLAVSMLVSE